jgi:hypothetical protein
MSDTNQHEAAESLFEPNQQRELEIGGALKLEAASRGCGQEYAPAASLAFGARCKIKQRVAARSKRVDASVRAISI